VPYLISLLTVAAATIVLLIVLARLRRPARRLIETALLCRAYLTDRTGLLTARIAGLKVELNRRLHRRTGSSPPPAA
jgi:uncharacterized small protein (DUF1192 family)